jgi:hypothetical protein
LVLVVFLLGRVVGVVMSFLFLTMKGS